jgi:tetratricopeptide (TPR) repeat protein
LERQGRGDTRDAALVLNNWSAMLQQAGQHLRAVALSERAVRIARERDGEHGASMVMLRSYGNALCAVGRCAEGVPLVEEAVSKAVAAGSARRRYSSVSTAATVHIGAGNVSRAAELLQEAERLLDSGRAEMPGQQAILERRQAQLALLRGDHAAAVTVAKRAAGREDDLRQDGGAAMQLMLVLAEALNAQGDFEAARAAAKRALEMTAPDDGMRHSSWAGQGHLELGVALAGLGDLGAGRAELGEALAHLRASLGPDAPFTRRALAQLERLGSPAPSPAFAAR